MVVVVVVAAAVGGGGGGGGSSSSSSSSSGGYTDLDRPSGLQEGRLPEHLDVGWPTATHRRTR